MPSGGVAGRQGFEPRFYGPEPYVLPLDDLPAGWPWKSSRTAEGFATRGSSRLGRASLRARGSRAASARDPWRRLRGLAGSRREPPDAPLGELGLERDQDHGLALRALGARGSLATSG